MLIVVDACALAGEVLRKRGQRILATSAVAFLIAEDTAHEAQRRLEARRAELKKRGTLSHAAIDEMIDAALGVIGPCVQIVPHGTYAHLESAARPRVPADGNDWPTIAVAMLLGASIWTEDKSSSAADARCGDRRPS